WACVRLNWSFARYARLRNWRDGDPSHPSAYVRALERIGFRVRFEPHPSAVRGQETGGSTPEPDARPPTPDPRADPAVERFFRAPMAAAALPAWEEVRERAGDLVDSFVRYFPSVYENSIPELAAFSAAAVGLFLARHWWLNLTLRRARRRVPLSVGG